ncbi:MAG: DUF58 domain-containing protein [Bradymonadia bacterium]
MTASTLQRIQREISRFEVTGIVPFTQSICGMTGEVKTAQVGQGDDFHAFDRYRVGDDIRMVDWSVYARTKRLWTKRFSQARTKQLILALDGSGSMRAGTEEKWTTTIECALILQGLCVRNGFDASILVFGPKGIEWAPSVMDGSSIKRCLDWLVHYRCEGTEHIDSLKYIGPGTAGELCVLSDFMWKDVLRDLDSIEVQTQLALTCIRVSSIVDTQVPDGGYFDPETHAVSSVDEGSLLQYRLDQFRNEIRETCRRKGKLFIDWSADDHTGSLKEWMMLREAARPSRVPG